MEKIGFVLCLISCGGIAEAYGNGKQLSLGLAMFIAGALLIAIGDLRHDIENNKQNHNCDSNILNRLHFLR